MRDLILKKIANEKKFVIVDVQKLSLSIDEINTLRTELNSSSVQCVYASLLEQDDLFIEYWLENHSRLLLRDYQCFNFDVSIFLFDAPEKYFKKMFDILSREIDVLIIDEKT